MGTVRCFFYKFIIPLFTIKLITGLYCLKYVLILLRIISSFHSFFEGTDEESIEERRRRIGFVSDLLVEGGLLAASHGEERERERERERDLFLFLFLLLLLLLFLKTRNL